MARRTRYVGTVAAVTGSAALALGLAAPANAEPPPRTQAGTQAVICDYAPPAQQQQQSAIDARYDSEPDLQQRLGAPVADEVRDGDVAYREYEHGRLYWTADTWVHETYGDILAKFLEQGGHPAFGVPLTDECGTADGNGRYNHFTGTEESGLSSVYWRPDLGAQLISGPVREHWEASGWETGTYGFPVSDTQPAGESGLFSDFEGDDGFGASIHFSPDSGTHGTKGSIRDHWLNLGGTGSYLGFPVSDEYDVPEGKRSDFQGGHIVFNADTGEVIDVPAS